MTPNEIALRLKVWSIESPSKQIITDARRDNIVIVMGDRTTSCRAIGSGVMERCECRCSYSVSALLNASRLIPDFDEMSFSIVDSDNQPIDHATFEVTEHYCTGIVFMFPD